MANASHASPAEKTGIVWLVGAGPGDPGLLTVRGAQLLAAADVVVYDYLSNPQLLSHAPAAEHIYVGKKAASHSMSQDQINLLLVEQGKLGKRIVRLKGGDPFVFGRGGEECEALAAAGIPFEVVPGITAAIAAPAYAGIPVTHRDLNSSFTLITGHEKEEEYRDPIAKERTLGAAASDIDWVAVARLPCVAFYMGVKALPRICDQLMSHGKSPDTLAATIQWGTTPRQRVVSSTLAQLPRAVADAGITAPAITLVGPVVSLRQTLNWFEKRPLFGQTIVVTRTRQQASELTQRLENLGAAVIEAPTIELAPAEDMAVVDAALSNAHGYDWIVFTSVNGVAFAKRRLMELGLDVRALGNARIATIGDATQRAVEAQLCRQVDLCPKEFVAEALAAALIAPGDVAGKRFLLLRADIARPVLQQRLSEAGAGVDDVAIYQTHSAKSLPTWLTQALDAQQVTWVTFTSSSTAKNFVELLGDDYRKRLKNVSLASIGPITTTTLRDLGLEPTAQASQYNIDGLIESLLAHRLTQSR